MGALIVTEFVTLDGVAQAPGGPDEDRESGFPYGGWQAPYFLADDDETGDDLFADASQMEALLLGRRTYEIFAAYWPTGPADSPFTELLNRIPKYVASRTLTGSLEWNGARLLDGDVAAAVREVKAQHRQVNVIGSLDLVQTLLRERLIDRLELWQYPLVLGTGKRVFGAGAVPTSLRLAASVAHGSGVVHLTYEPAGEPTYGTVGEDPSS